MEPKIVALACPSCGNATDISGKDARFGFHFSCGYCNTQSVLVINQQLYVPHPNEQVCAKCGRVAKPGARYCQCKSPLSKSCWFCRSENPINDDICSQCGRSFSVQQADMDDFLDCVQSEIEEAKSKPKPGNNPRLGNS